MGTLFLESHCTCSKTSEWQTRTYFIQSPFGPQGQEVIVLPLQNLPCLVTSNNSYHPWRPILLKQNETNQKHGDNIYLRKHYKARFVYGVLVQIPARNTRWGGFLLSANSRDIASQKCLRSRDFGLTLWLYARWIQLFSINTGIHRNKIKSEVRLPNFDQVYVSKSFPKLGKL